MLRCFAAVTLAAAILIGGTAAAEPVFPTGTRIGLEPAGALKVAAGFPGFEDPDAKVTVAILDLPGRVYEDVLRATFADDQPGLTGVKRETFPFKSGVGYLLTAQATEDGAPVRRFFLVAPSTSGNERDLVAMVKVGVPDAARKTYTDEAVREMLASITFRETPVQEQLGQLPFKLGQLAGFRVFQVLRDGGVILTEGPSDDLRNQPTMIISAGPGAPASPDERGRFARDLLATAPLRDVTVELSEPMRIGGGPGYEIRAKAEAPGTVRVALVQWVRFGGSGYLRVVGTAPPDSWDTLFPRFRAVRDGIEIR